MIDARLVAIDHGLGFDWNAYVHWLAGFPALAHGLDIAYNLMVVEMGLVMCLLCIKRRFRDSERFIYAYLSALLLTAVIASLWPAVGAYGYWGIDPANLGLNPPAARIHEPDMLALRSGELRYFPLVMKGLVTFPSFHTATALLLTFAAWPLRYARLPALALNIAMIVSVLACGSHYLSDILGGIAVALAGWVLAGRILPK